VTEQRPPSKNPWLAMSPMPRAIGIVLIVVGGVWFLQGIGVAQGSVMTGRPLWAVLGVAAVVAGALVLRRSLNAAKAENQAESDAAAPPDEPTE
jgi:hypothetical protein